MPRKLVLNGKRKLSFEEYQDMPLSSSSVLLKTLYSAVSHGSESMLFEGNAPKFEYLWDANFRHFSKQKPISKHSYSIGYESVAVVVEVGSDVHSWDIGEIVWIDGPHKQTHILDLNNPVPFMRFPSSTNPKQLAFLALSRVALGAVHDANPLLGDSVGVVGLGTVGQLCVQLLHNAGVKKIAGIDNNPTRLALAKEFGAIPIDFTLCDPAKMIKEEIGPLDMVIEASGTYSGLSTAIKCVAPMGKVIVVSSYGNQSNGLQLGHEFHRNRITLISSMTINECTHPKFPLWTLERLNQECAKLLTDGTLSTDKLITQVIPFSNAIEAIENIVSSPNPPLKILFAYE